MEEIRGSEIYIFYFEFGKLKYCKYFKKINIYIYILGPLKCRIWKWVFIHIPILFDNFSAPINQTIFILYQLSSLRIHLSQSLRFTQSSISFIVL